LLEPRSNNASVPNKRHQALLPIVTDATLFLW